MALQDTALRLDKWLWAARFFKTRALAGKAVRSGQVRRAGQRTKPSHGVKLNDCYEIVRGYERVEVIVTGLTSVRGSADQARRLYQETAISRERRDAEAKARQLANMQRPRSDAKPDKKQRRKIRQFSGKI